MYICSTANEHHEWMKESSMQHVSSASALNYYWGPQTKKQATQSNPESADVMTCKYAMQKHRMNKKLAAAAADWREKRWFQFNPIKSSARRSQSPNNSCAGTDHIIEQVDRRHQQAVSVRSSLWSVGGYVYASTTVSFFQRFQRSLYRSVRNSDEFHHQFPRLRRILHSSWSSVRCHYFFSWLAYYCLLACCREKAASSPEEHAGMQVPNSSRRLI